MSVGGCGGLVLLGVGGEEEEVVSGGVRLQVKIICGRLADGHCHI